MEVVNNLFRLLVDCVQTFSHRELTIFLSTIFGGVFLAVAGWILCSRYARLWNLRYHITVTHHVLCGIAAVLTLFFAVTFASLKYTRLAAEILVAGWQLQILSDSAWEEKTFRKTFDAIKGLGVEDFTSFPDPDQGGHLVPLQKSASRQTLATVYSTEAVNHFNMTHPYLSKILTAETGISPEMITDDVTAFFAGRPHENYSNMNAVRLAANHIRQSLDAQITRVVPITRTIIVLLFLIVQAIPFGLVGVAAYRDLKVVT